MIWGFHLLFCDIGIGCVATMSVRSEEMLLNVHHSWAARTIFPSVLGMVHYSIAIVVNVFFDATDSGNRENFFAAIKITPIGTRVL